MSIGADPRSAAGLYERKWERYSVNRQGMLMTVGFDLGAPKMRSCQLIDISQGGAVMKTDEIIARYRASRGV